MKFCHAAAVLGGLLFSTLAAAPAAAQWDTITYEPTSPVYDEGFLVLHENLDGINAFSAVTRKWTRLSDVGPTIEGTGDWVALLSQPANTGVDFTGYSARRNRTDVLPVVQAFATYVEDDVALVIARLEDGIIYGCGFSGATARWEVQPLGFEPAPNQIATSRFVAGIVSPDSQEIYGFAARTGRWHLYTTDLPIGLPDADGNTLIVPLQQVGGPPRIAAFSGVRGAWATSPPYLIDDGVSPLLDHNVAYVRTPGVGGFSGSAYSAYGAQWYTSGAVHALDPSIGESVSDNVVLLSDENMFIPAPRYEAFGSRPSTWDGVFGNWSSEYLDEDYALIRNVNAPEIAGFSGLCRGEWVVQDINFENSAFALASPDHLGLMQEPGLGIVFDRLWAFRPSIATWVGALDLIPGTTLSIADLMADVEQPSTDPTKRDLVACTDRFGGWRSESAPAGTYDITVGGSVIAHKLTMAADPADVGKIWLFDERCDEWQAPFFPGADQPLDADRNVMLSYPEEGASGEVWGYSVQRGDWHQASGAPMPLTELPRLEENVAWMVDGDAVPQLWAFGSPNVGHVDYQWPNGTEYHSSAIEGDPVPGPLFAYTILGIPGATIARPLVSANVDCEGTTFDGFEGVLCLDFPVISSLGFLSLTGSDCLEELLLNFNNPLAACVQVWLQPLAVNLTLPELRFEHRCDPAWIF